MKIAVKVGGSVFSASEKPDDRFVKRLSEALLELSEEHKLLVVVGGGRLARKMIQDTRPLTSSKKKLHFVGIMASRVNASVLVLALGENVFSGIPKNVKEVKDAFSEGKIVVTGGFKPGQTTDAVTLQSAEALGADLVIIGTDVKGVYDKDPKKFRDARLLKRIEASKLREMVESEGMEPGKKTIVDPIAAKIVEKRGMKTFVLDVRDLDNLKKAIAGEDFEGTVII